MRAYCNLKEFEEIINYSEIPNKPKCITSKLLEKEFSGTFFTQLSIFDDETRGTISKDKQKVNQILKSLPNIPSDISEKHEKAMGSMLGMAIGDAMGHRFEFQPVEYDKIELVDMGEGPGGAFKLSPGQWTDDSSMGLCLADSLLVNKGKLVPHDLMHRFISWWKGGYNNAFRYNEPPRHSVGLGGNISQSFYRYFKETEEETKSGDESTSGNGSIMRNAAVPLCYNELKDMDEAMDIARKQSLTTHQGIEAAYCCALLTHIIVKLMNNEDLHQVLDNLGKTFDCKVQSIKALANSEQEGNDIDRNWNWKDKNFKFSPTRSKLQPGYIGSYAMDGLSMALHIVYHTNSFKEAIIKAVNLRGDSDSVGSVVGQITGAFYGLRNIPVEWVKTVYRWDHGEFALRGYMLVNVRKGLSSVNKENK